MSTLFFHLIYFLYFLLHNLTGSTDECDRGNPYFFFWGRRVHRIQVWRSINVSTIHHPLSSGLNAFPISHGCLTDLVSERLLYLSFNDFKSHGHIHRLLKMILLELSVWRKTVLSEEKKARHTDKIQPGISKVTENAPGLL